ncbi:MAG: restriction endonuclease subunit S, partial [Schleiferiaceae bacterium]|nr:restriction endonuclease subunit S [Schleiferiaceae bacterium]
MRSEWTKSNIGAICKKVTSGGTPKVNVKEYYENGHIPWLNTKEVKFNNIWDTEKKITELALENSAAKMIPENSVIVAMYGATAGKVAVNKLPLSTNQACCNLIIDEALADYRFIYYNLSGRTKYL